MTCLEIQELLSAFVDNELDDDNMKKVQKHLEKCPRCKKDVEELKDIISGLSSFEDVPIPEVFDDRLHKALTIEGQDIRNSKAIPIAKKKKINWIRISSVAAVFIVGLFSVILYNNNLEEFDKLNSDNLNCVLYDTTEQIQESEINDSTEKNEDLQVSDETRNSDNYGTSNTTGEMKKSRNIDNSDSAVEESPNGLSSSQNQEITPKVQSSMALDSVNEDQIPEPINSQNIDEELNSYLEDLDNLLIDSTYIVNSCTKNDVENMWTIDITIMKINSEDKEIKENAVYYGQDGKLWKKEL